MHGTETPINGEPSTRHDLPALKAAIASGAYQPDGARLDVAMDRAIDAAAADVDDVRMPRIHPASPPYLRYSVELELLRFTARAIEVRLPGGTRKAWLPKSAVHVTGRPYSKVQTVFMPGPLYVEKRKELV